MDIKNVESEQKSIHLWLFFYSLYTCIFVWIQHYYLATGFFALELSNDVIKQLWCSPKYIILDSVHELVNINY